MCSSLKTRSVGVAHLHDPLQVHGEPDVFETEDPPPPHTDFGDDTSSSSVEKLPSGVSTSYGSFVGKSVSPRFVGECTYIRTYIYVYMCTCICIHTYVRMYVCTYVHMYDLHHVTSIMKGSKSETMSKGSMRSNMDHSPH